MKLKVICAWCTETMEVKELDGGSSMNAVTHGICQSCKDKALEEFLNAKHQNTEKRRLLCGTLQLQTGFRRYPSSRKQSAALRRTS